MTATLQTPLRSVRDLDHHALGRTWEINDVNSWHRITLTRINMLNDQHGMTGSELIGASGETIHVSPFALAQAA